MCCSGINIKKTSVVNVQELTYYKTNVVVFLKNREQVLLITGSIKYTQKYHRVRRTETDHDPYGKKRPRVRIH